MEEKAYHGTDVDIESEILPTSVTGNYRSEGGAIYSDVTYFTPSESLAWHAAIHKFPKPGEQKTRPRVYETQPVGEVTTDPNFSERHPGKWNPNSLAAPKQTIKDVHWIPTVPEGSHGVQGTLPGVDWEKHGVPNYRVLNQFGKQFSKYPWLGA